jgi:hypothetical protein
LKLYFSYEDSDKNKNPLRKVDNPKSTFLSGFLLKSNILVKLTIYYLHIQGVITGEI